MSNTNIHNHTVIPVDPRVGASGSGVTGRETIGDFANRLSALPSKLDADGFIKFCEAYGAAHGIDYIDAVKRVKIHAYAWADDYKGGNTFVYSLRAKMHRGWTESQTKAILNCMRVDPEGRRVDRPESTGKPYAARPESIVWSGGVLPNLNEKIWDATQQSDGTFVHITSLKSKIQIIWSDNGDGSVALVQPADGKWDGFVFISYSPDVPDYDRKRISTYGWEKMGMIRPDSSDEVLINKTHGPGTKAYSVFESVASKVAVNLAAAAGIEPTPAPAPVDEPSETEGPSAEPETPVAEAKLTPAEIRAAIAARRGA